MPHMLPALFSFYCDTILFYGHKELKIEELNFIKHANLIPCTSHAIYIVEYAFHAQSTRW
jgi:hypothetical protein